MLIFSPVLLAQPAVDEPRGHIEGRVVDATTMQPVAGARVEVVGHPRYEERFSELTGEERPIGFGFLGNAGFKLEF